MSNWDPTASYGPGGTAPVDSSGNVSLSDPVTSTEDSMYGLSTKLGAIPVKITSGGQVAGAKGYGLDTYGGGNAPGPTPPQIIPWESARALIYTMSPAERAQLQQQMYEAHLYPDSYYGTRPHPIVPGVLDPGTVSAWFNTVQEAVRSSTYDANQKNITNGKSIQDVLNERIQLNQQEAAAGGAAPRNPVRLTSPTDLRAYAKSAGQKFLGRNPDPGFVDNYVAAYHAAEVASGQPDPTTGNIQSPPDPSAFAEQMLRQQYPVDVGVNDALNVGNEMVNILSRGPGGGTLPTDRTVNG